MRFAAVTAALLVLAFGFTAARFRNPEGYVSGAVVVPIAVAAALAGFAFLARGGWAKPIAWLALGVVGQAVALQLVRAGYMVGYQHYVPIDQITGPRFRMPVVFVGLQAMIVGVAMLARLPAIVRWLRGHLGMMRLLLIGSVFAISSATLSRDPVVYGTELILATAVQLLAIGTFVLAAQAVPAHGTQRLRAWLDRLLGAETAPVGGGPDRFAWLAAGFVVLACALLATFSYQRHPHVPDEVVYLYHARYFARGWLAMPLPPVPEAFNLDLMTYEATRWYSPVPPGWPAVLAIGAFFGAAWLVNPILNGINVLLAYLLLRELYGVRTARLATLLLASSPWFVFMGMNFMTHTWTMTAALAGAVGVARLRRAVRVPWGWLVAAGVGIGIVGLIRPLEGVTLALLLGLWALGGTARRGLARLLPVAAMAMVSIATVSITFPYNQAMAGSPTTFPLMAYTDSVYGVGTNALGFGANRGLGWPGLDPLPGHGAVDVLVNGNLNVFQVNIELFGWATGSLLPILLLLGFGRLQRADVWMLIVILAIVGVHSFYWFSGGPDFGARYWYLILLPCIALAARGIETLAERLRSDDAAGAPSSHGSEPRVTATALALALAALLTFFPWRAIDKYFHYRNMRPDVRALAKRHDMGRAIVFVRGNRHPDYASAAIYNPLDYDDDVPIFVWDRGPDVQRRVLEAFPDRDIWIIDGPTRTWNGFHIRGGRIPPETLFDPGTNGRVRP